VRELANAIERAAIVAKVSTLREEDLPPMARRAAGHEVAGRQRTAAREGTPDAVDARIETVERSHITLVLERTGWVIEGKNGAAAILGLAPSTLRSRMAQLGIRRATK
jgi:transcriptional regulator with GAF, ATPase, and Fis domain